MPEPRIRLIRQAILAWRGRHESREFEITDFEVDDLAVEIALLLEESDE